MIFFKYLTQFLTLNLIKNRPENVYFKKPERNSENQLEFSQKPVANLFVRLKVLNKVFKTF